MGRYRRHTPVDQNHQLQDVIEEMTLLLPERLNLLSQLRSQLSDAITPPIITAYVKQLQQQLTEEIAYLLTNNIDPIDALAKVKLPKLKTDLLEAGFKLDEIRQTQGEQIIIDVIDEDIRDRAGKFTYTQKNKPIDQFEQRAQAINKFIDLWTEHQQNKEIQRQIEEDNRPVYYEIDQQPFNEPSHESLDRQSIHSQQQEDVKSVIQQQKPHSLISNIGQRQPPKTPKQIPIVMINPLTNEVISEQDIQQQVDKQLQEIDKQEDGKSEDSVDEVMKLRSKKKKQKPNRGAGKIEKQLIWQSFGDKDQAIINQEVVNTQYQLDQSHPTNYIPSPLKLLANELTNQRKLHSGANQQAWFKGQLAEIYNDWLRSNRIDAHVDFKDGFYKVVSDNGISLQQQKLIQTYFTGLSLASQRTLIQPIVQNLLNLQVNDDQVQSVVKQPKQMSQSEMDRLINELIQFNKKHEVGGQELEQQQEMIQQQQPELKLNVKQIEREALGIANLGFILKPYQLKQAFIKFFSNIQGSQLDLQQPRNDDQKRHAQYLLQQLPDLKDECPGFYNLLQEI